MGTPPLLPGLSFATPCTLCGSLCLRLMASTDAALTAVRAIAVKSAVVAGKVGNRERLLARLALLLERSRARYFVCHRTVDDGVHCPASEPNGRARGSC